MLAGTEKERDREREIEREREGERERFYLLIDLFYFEDNGISTLLL